MYSIQMKHLLLACGLLAGVPVLKAQDDALPKKEKSRVTVRVVEENGEDRIVKEHSYDTGELSQQQQRAHLDSLLNALDIEGKGKNRRITITMEDGDLQKPGLFDMARKSRPARADFRWEELDKMSWQLDTALSKSAAKVEFKVNKLLADIESRPMDFHFDIGDRIKKAKAFNMDWESGFPNSSKTVRAVAINPNKPFDGHLNLRFTVREKGDVLITVTDTKGKEQAKKELRDFEGEFVGQIKLKDSASGVLFVNIVQNEDGVSQRVSLPEKTGSK